MLASALASHALPGGSEIRRGLHREELRVAATEVDELVVRPALDDAALVEDIDAIRRTDAREAVREDRKSTRLNSSHVAISYAVFCLKKKKKINDEHSVQ